jgi:hypothetical protein
MPELRCCCWRARCTRTLAHVALAVVACACARQCLAGPVQCTAQPRAQDSVWLVSSRGLSACRPAENVTRLRYWRFDRQQSWLPSSLHELVASDDPAVTTVLFLHGNRVEANQAFADGWYAYRRLMKSADDRPVRFVIWSWPSEQYCGPLNDARIKAARTNSAAYYVAWFTRQIGQEVPLSLWGYSYGARIASGALHLLGGGSLAGRRLDEAAPAARRPLQVVLVAAALDDHSLLPGHANGKALSQANAMLLVNNGCDRVLKRYQVLYPGRGCQQALGYVGLAAACLAEEDARKIRQIDACCHVGNQHQFVNYLESPYLMARMRAYLLFQKPQAHNAPQASPPVADNQADLSELLIE